MILTNTKNTGYSLGLPLWLNTGDDIISTGILQGIMLTLELPEGAEELPAVYLSRYKRDDNAVYMIFSTAAGLLCSLNATLSGEPQTFSLQNETDSSSSIKFISGSVTLYALGGSLELDLTGAQVCPKYIQFGYPAGSSPSLEIIAGNSAAQDKQSVYWKDITPETSVDVSVTSGSSGGYIASAIIISPVDVALQDTSLIQYINGSSVDSSGEFVINLSGGWVISGNGLCAKIGVATTDKSCPTVNYIEETLNPGNYTHSCPFNIAFSGGKLVMDQVYNHRFNTEYESCCSGGVVSSGACVGGGTVISGLAWNEFSHLHDYWVES